MPTCSIDGCKERSETSNLTRIPNKLPFTILEDFKLLIKNNKIKKDMRVCQTHEGCLPSQLIEIINKRRALEGNKLIVEDSYAKTEEHLFKQLSKLSPEERNDHIKQLIPRLQEILVANQTVSPPNSANDDHQSNKQVKCISLETKVVKAPSAAAATPFAGDDNNASACDHETSPVEDHADNKSLKRKVVTYHSVQYENCAKKLAHTFSNPTYHQTAKPVDKSLATLQQEHEDLLLMDDQTNEDVQNCIEENLLPNELHDLGNEILKHFDDCVIS